MKQNVIPVDLSSDWNPGRLVHYGRAELKQSDHRPVIAVIDIEIFHVDDSRRSQVFMEVVQDLGPPDATIVVQVRAQSFLVVCQCHSLFVWIAPFCETELITNVWYIHGCRVLLWRLCSNDSIILTSLIQRLKVLQYSSKALKIMTKFWLNIGKKEQSLHVCATDWNLCSTSKYKTKFSDCHVGFMHHDSDAVLRLLSTINRIRRGVLGSVVRKQA